MRKILFCLALFICAILIASLIAWVNRAHIAAHYLAKQLHVPVTIRSLEITRTEADIARLWIGNPPRSQTSTSFSAETVAILSNVDQIMGDPLIIEEIDIANIFIGLEYYGGKETNWTHILDDRSHRKKRKKERNYLIRTLILENLTVEVTKADGSIKRYPTIPRMEFHNISDETGFPIEEIEKAIFNLMMKDLFKKLNIEDLLKQLPFSPGGSPLKYLPDLFNP